MPFPPPLPPMPQPPDDVLQVVVGESKRIERLGEDFAGEKMALASCPTDLCHPVRHCLSRCVPIYGIPAA